MSYRVVFKSINPFIWPYIFGSASWFSAVIVVWFCFRFCCFIYFFPFNFSPCSNISINFVCVISLWFYLFWRISSLNFFCVQLCFWFISIELYYLYLLHSDLSYPFYRFTRCRFSKSQHLYLVLPCVFIKFLHQESRKIFKIPSIFVPPPYAFAHPTISIYSTLLSRLVTIGVPSSFVLILTFSFKNLHVF